MGKGLGSAPGKPGFGAVVGGGTYPRRAGGVVPGCHRGRARAPAKPSVGCHGLRDAVMDGDSIIPDLSTCPGDKSLLCPPSPKLGTYTPRGSDPRLAG